MAPGSSRSGPPPVVVGSLGAALALAVVALLLVAGGGGFDGFVHASPEFADPVTTPVELAPAGGGFDGQFYLRMAAEPLSDATRVEGIAFDLPALRSARVTYPALAGGFGLVPVSALPVTLVAVNIVAAVGWPAWPRRSLAEQGGPRGGGWRRSRSPGSCTRSASTWPSSWRQPSC